MAEPNDAQTGARQGGRETGMEGQDGSRVFTGVFVDLFNGAAYDDVEALRVEEWRSQ